MPCASWSGVPTMKQPPPDVAAVPPSVASCSSSTTRAPAACASSAPATPAAPPPMIATSVSMRSAGMTPPVSARLSALLAQPLLGARQVGIERAQAVVRDEGKVLVGEAPQLGHRLGMQVDPQVHDGERLAVDDVEPGRLLAVGLAARALARLERGEQPLPDWAPGLGLERLEHGVDHARPHDQVGGGHDVARRPVPRPGPVAGAGAPGGMAADVETA